MNPYETFLHNALAHLDASGARRTLTQPNPRLVDCSSNDYLGLARRDAAPLPSEKLTGATGSRLISGNSALAEAFEAFLADYHHTEAALLFNAGYDANLAFFSSVPQRGDVVLYDALVHASIRDGIRLGFAAAFAFRHNDTAHLAERLATLRSETPNATQRRIFVAIETLYSMDGDFAPVAAIASLCEAHDAALVVDEAHSTGVYGTGGRGYLHHIGERRVFARLHTFGKALGAHGAAWCGSDALRSFLINKAHAFIYSTALPPHAIATAWQAYRVLSTEAHTRQQALYTNIGALHAALSPTPFATNHTLPPSPIYVHIVPTNARVTAAAAALQSAGFDVRAIRSPTVKAGAERLRVCVHSHNTPDEMTRLADALGKLPVHE